MSEKKKQHWVPSLCLMGPQRVGKTSFGRRLLHDSFDPRELTTTTLNLDSCSRLLIDTRPPLLRSGPANEQDSASFREPIVIKDFCASPATASLYFWFMPKKAVYMWMDEAQNFDNIPTDNMLCGLAPFMGHNPLLIGLNKMDVSCPSSESRRSVENILEDLYPNTRRSFSFSSATKAGLNDAITGIAEQIQALTDKEPAFPETWALCRKSLGDRLKTHLPLKEFRKICADHAIRTEAEQNGLLEALCDYGYVWHHKSLSPCADRIFNPLFVADALHALLDSPLLRKQEGLLEEGDTKYIWKDRQMPSQEEAQKDRDLLLQLALDMGVAFRDKDTANVIVPSVLPFSATGESLDEPPHTILEARYRADPPPFIMPEYIAYMHDALARPPHVNRVVLHRGAAQVHVCLSGMRSRRAIRIELAGKEEDGDALLQRTMDFFTANPKIPAADMQLKVSLDQRDCFVSLDHLTRLHKAGEKTFWPQGLDKPINVAEALAPIERLGSLSTTERPKAPCGMNSHSANGADCATLS